MRRRSFLQSSAAAAAASAFSSGFAFAAKRTPNWGSLRNAVGDRLIDINSPLVQCARNQGAGADALFAELKNPYYLSDHPALTQTLGWVDAWTSQPSLKGVAAESAADVAAAIDFCRNSRIPPVIKGGGHSYFGNSNGAGSLLVWTHRMRQIELHDAFVPAGASLAHGTPAVSIGAGCLWGEIYRKVAVEHGRYVQGGGCLTVGVAGLILGGGFGSLSKQYGTGAANLIEAEVVTADGRIRTANEFRNPDLFFALRGGGGGTFGAVTRLTLRTHPLPSFIGALIFDVTAADEQSWRALVSKVVDFYATSLFNPSWGEQIGFGPGRRLRIFMVSQGLSQQQIEDVWAPFAGWVKERPKSYVIERGPIALAMPGGGIWDPAVIKRIPGLVLQDGRPGAPAENVFWQANLQETAETLYAYQSAWLAAPLLAPERRESLVDALVRASAIWDFALHTNKGLAGGAPEAIAATRATSTNPQVLDAFALVICSANDAPAYPGIPGHEPRVATGRRDAARVASAMREFYKIAPNAGAYVSEADYFQRDWKRAYWGSHYPRLAAAKRKYDPQWLFRGHYTVEPT